LERYENFLFILDKMEINKDNIEKKLRDEFEPTYLVRKYTG